MFGPYVNNGENGRLYVRVIQFEQFFEKGRSPPPLSGALFNADHDELIKITFSEKKTLAPTCIFGQIITQEPKNVKFENNGKLGSRRCQMMRGFQIWNQN